jgi:hypothetical protein
MTPPQDLGPLDGLPTEVARLVVLDPVEADPAGIPKSDTETRSA